jgi:hypothetical protein
MTFTEITSPAGSAPAAAGKHRAVATALPPPRGQSFADSSGVRVQLAKFVSAVLLSIVVLTATTLLALGATAIGDAIVGHGTSYAGLGGALAGAYLTTALNVVMGAAFGAVFAQTAVAIVVSFFPRLLGRWPDRRTVGKLTSRGQTAAKKRLQDAGGPVDLRESTGPSGVSSDLSRGPAGGRCVCRRPAPGNL